MATTETVLHHLVDKRFVGVTPDGMRVMIDGERRPQDRHGPDAAGAQRGGGLRRLRRRSRCCASAS
jgi:hypothetical protein